MLGCHFLYIRLARIKWIWWCIMGLWGGLVVKNLPRMKKMQKTPVQSLAQQNTLEEGLAPHSSTLAWRSPWTEEPGRLQSIGLQSVRHDWNDWASMHPHTIYNTLLVEVWRSSHSDTHVLLFEINFANKLIEEKFSFSTKRRVLTLRPKNPISTDLLWRYIS